MEDCVQLGYLVININDMDHVVILCKIVCHVTCMMFSIGNACAKFEQNWTMHVQ